MDIDKKTIAGAAAAVAVGVAGAVAYTALKGGGTAKKERPPQGQGKRKGEAPPAPTGPINLNQATPQDLMSLKHIGKARAKRILHARPFKSVDDLVSRGLVPAEVLAPVRDRLTI
ncbi:MAG TPA: helix-hairpin-helix domain-containing protein [Azospirillum sp.]|nr:helix-hairpin-helix domain-containing protein [Azospirillum sp.]